MGATVGFAVGLPLVSNRLDIFVDGGGDLLVSSGGEIKLILTPIGVETGVSSRIGGAVFVRVGPWFHREELRDTYEETLVEDELSGTFAGLRIRW